MVQGKVGNLSRGDFLRLGGAGIVGATLLGTAGCGGDTDRRGGPVELTFFFGGDDTGTSQNLIRKFNQENKGRFKVNYREGNADTGQRLTQLRTEFQAGRADMDVIGGDIIWTAELAAKGWILDLSDRFTQDMRGEWLPGSVEGVTYGNKVYGVPWFTDTGLLYYRQDLLEDSGFSEPPKTWDALKEMATKVMQDSGIPNGLVFQGASYEGGVCNGLEYIWSAGGRAVAPEDPSKIVMQSPESVTGLQMERSMVTEGLAPQAVAQSKEDESQGIFLRGDAVFHRNWPYVYSLLSDPAQSEIKPDQVGVTELPSIGIGGTGHGTVGDQPVYINATSEKQDAAWELIKFLNAPEQQKYRALEGGYLPTRGNLYEDEEIRKKVPIVPLAGEALQHTRPRPVSPYYSDMSLVLAEQFNASLKGNVTPEQAVQTIQKELSNIIERAANS